MITALDSTGYGWFREQPTLPEKPPEGGSNLQQIVDPAHYF
jgi:hypothetical protein